MAASLRLEADGVTAVDVAPGPAARRWTYIRVFCLAQVLMVVANLGRIPVLSTDERDFPIAFNEICLGVMVVGAALTIRSWKSVFLDRVGVTALLFAAIGGGSALWALNRFDMGPLELFVSLAYLGRWLMYFALYVALINVARERSVEAIWGAVETMLVIFALFGMVQSALLPNFAQMIYHDNRSFNWDAQRHRLISTVLEPNIAGTMLMMGLLVQIARVTVGASVKRWRMFAIFVGLTLTISRSAAVGMFFGMLVILATYGLSRRLVRAMLAAGCLLMLASPFLIRFLMAYDKFSIGEGSSAAIRFTIWAQALRMAIDYPIFGIGFNTYRYALEHYGIRIVGASSYGAEGGLLFVATMTGLVGLTVYCFMIYQVWRRCRAIWRDATVPANQRGLAIGTVAATIGMIVASLFVNALMTTFVMEIVWVLWALTFVIARAQGARRAAVAAPAPPRLVAFGA